MTKQNKTNRREFLRTAATAATAFTILPYSLHGIAPSDQVRTAHIGVGGMGNAHVRWFSDLPGVTVAALCDVDKKHLRKTAKALRKNHPELKPDLYRDFREVMDRKDIDVVSCATPDHWHAQIAIAAFAAGKDVYGEKPLVLFCRRRQGHAGQPGKAQPHFPIGHPNSRRGQLPPGGGDRALRYVGQD